MKRILGIICIIITIVGCSSPAYVNVSIKDIEANYNEQISRLEKYAEEFQDYHENGNGIVRKTWYSKNDEKLFFISEILEADLLRERNGLSIHNVDIQGMITTMITTNNIEHAGSYPLLDYGTALTSTGKKVEVVVYRSEVVEKKTGLKVACRIVFDRDELKKKSEQKRL